MHTTLHTVRFRVLMTTFLLGLLSNPLCAQLTPDRLYIGVGQRVVVTVGSPDDFFGELTIKLHDPRTLQVIHSAPAAKGRVDLTSLFPTIWADKSEQVMLAQLYLDSTATGSPLVLQPLVTPNIATRVEESTMKLSEDSQAKVVFQDDRLSTQFARGEVESLEREKAYSGMRVYVEQEIVMQTSAGEIVFRMRPDAAPNTAYNFMHLVEGGFYTNIIFHRVVATLADGRPFVIQVGDPSGTGSGGPGYMVDLEKTTLLHDFGVLSMARSADPNTNGSQVFVCLSREGTEFLDGRYTAFAQAVSGADVIRKIAAVPVDSNDRPLDPPMIEETFVRDAPSIANRASPLSAQEAVNGGADSLPAEPDR
jgi:peptidyl-prolyl cis-trans isomerase B (cyclophilin B)